MKKRYIFILIAIIGIVVIFRFSLKTFSKLNNSFELSLPSTYGLTLEDSALFDKNELNRITVVEIVRSKTRNPISYLLIDGKFNLVLYRINLTTSKPLSNVLDYKMISQEVTVGESYRIIYTGKYKILFKDISPDDSLAGPISKIHLSIYGDSIRSNVFTDSIVGYKLRLKNFTVSYYDKDIKDIVGRLNENETNTTIGPLSRILLLKKNNAVYLLFVTPKDGQSSIPDGLLSTLIVNK